MPQTQTLPDQAVYKALSVRQPWAHLIIHHGKDIENRSWRTSHRGPLLIHASQKFDMPGYRRVLRNFPKIAKALPATFTTGAIVGWVNLIDCVENSVSLWYDGPIGWKLSNPHPIEPPLPAKGRLGLWEITRVEIIAAITN